jgi:uncharacterized protein (UPF0332 family)
VTLHHDLLEQARHLARREPKKPRQASLRRAVSSAYYALFHMLLHEGTQLLFPNKPAGLRERASRAFSHGEARTVCEAWAKGNPIVDFAALPIEPQLQDIAATFVNLQEARHKADYDLKKTFDRVEVLRLIDKVQGAMHNWKAVKNTDNSNIFLSSLLLHNRWNKYNN